MPAKENIVISAIDLEVDGVTPEEMDEVISMAAERALEIDCTQSVTKIDEN